MRTIVLILAIAAVGLGVRHFHKQHPHVLEDVVAFVTGAPEDGSDDAGSDEGSDVAASDGAPRRTIDTISTGDRVDAAKHAAPRGRTIVEFTADW